MELSGELLIKWKTIMSELSLLNKVRIPRCYCSSRCVTVTTQLHGFCDASKQAFAAVIYLRSVYVNGTVEVALVASKTRISPRYPLLGTTRCCYPESPHEKYDFLFVKTNIHFLLDRLYGNTVLDTNYQALEAICQPLSF